MQKQDLTCFLDELEGVFLAILGFLKNDQKSTFIAFRTENLGSTFRKRTNGCESELDHVYFSEKLKNRIEQPKISWNTCLTRFFWIFRRKDTQGVSTLWDF